MVMPLSHYLSSTVWLYSLQQQYTLVMLLLPYIKIIGVKDLLHSQKGSLCLTWLTGFKVVQSPHATNCFPCISHDTSSCAPCFHSLAPNSWSCKTLPPFITSPLSPSPLLRPLWEVFWISSPSWVLSPNQRLPSSSSFPLFALGYVRRCRGAHTLSV